MDVLKVITIFGFIWVAHYLTFTRLRNYLKEKQFNIIGKKLSDKGDFNSLSDSEKLKFLEYVESTNKPLKYDSEIYAMQCAVYISFSCFFSLLVLIKIAYIIIEFYSIYDLLFLDKEVTISVIDDFLIQDMPILLIFVLGQIVFYKLYKEAKANKSASLSMNE